MAGPRPIELILARNFLASLSTPAFLVDEQGEIAFYNEAAGTLLGRRYEESGPMPAEVWTTTFGPFDEKDRPIPFHEIDVTEQVKGNRPAHQRFCIRTTTSDRQPIELSALPIVGVGGYRGALVVFWPTEEAE